MFLHLERFRDPLVSIYSSLTGPNALPFWSIQTANYLVAFEGIQRWGADSLAPSQRQELSNSILLTLLHKDMSNKASVAEHLNYLLELSEAPSPGMNLFMHGNGPGAQEREGPDTPNEMALFLLAGRLDHDDDERPAETSMQAVIALRRLTLVVLRYVGFD